MQAPQLVDMTAKHLPNTMRGVTATGGMNVRFEWTRVRIDNTADATINGEYEQRLTVIRSPKGDRLTESRRFISPEDAQRYFPEEFAQFSTYGDVPLYGTPLQELPGLTQSQVSYLSLFGIRSIEDLVDISEDIASANMGIEGVRARKIAVAWQARNEEAGGLPDLAQKEAAMDAERKARDAREADMMAQITELTAQIKAFQSMKGADPQAAAPAGMMAGASSGAATQAAMVMDGGEDDDLPTDLSSMPDPFSEGPDTGDASEAIGTSTEVDPLADEV